MERQSKYQTRSFKTGDTALIAGLHKRDDGTEEKVIEGYFAVFNQETELWPGAYEEISPDAFNETLSEDIRALINHDTTLVLGRNTSGTLELREDARGLWGSIKTNPNDMDAMNLYERVRRGDVTQCSFGFDILKEKTEWRDDGSVKWILEKVKLYEVSVCTFPAYEGTGVQARHDEVKQHQKRQLEQRKKEVEERIKNVKTACIE
ncbi:HK97 family phage prohead protease [Eubacterium callanderi]|uniref:HK97 family phage prohead protease n=1 Tax=Eubacterium callanderi TaxID=53442 RepID=UPI002670F482|nr:HK97 family phage prohead protease [Eubacterium callanderi]